MELINITEFEAHERRQRRTRARYGFRVEEDDEPKRNQVLCGLGTAYLRPHIHRGRIEMFAPGVFAASLASGRRVNLQLDHNGGMVVATTASGLELDETDLGLFLSPRSAPHQSRGCHHQHGRRRQSRVRERRLPSRE